MPPLQPAKALLLGINEQRKLGRVRDNDRVLNAALSSGSPSLAHVEMVDSSTQKVRTLSSGVTNAEMGEMGRPLATQSAWTSRSSAVRNGEVNGPA